MATAQQIRNAYLDYVLTNDEKPKLVYIFVKKLKITEADFYQFFSSFESIEKTIWFELTFETINKIKEQEVWPQYTAREKMLSFFYSYLENLKNERSFVIYSLKNHRGKFSTPDVLAGVKPIFENFAQEIIEEGLDSGERAERRFLSKRYKDALWIQFAFIVNFGSTMIVKVSKKAMRPSKKALM
jgi:hypothetical protein